MSEVNSTTAGDEAAAVDALLDAFDQVANGNAHLLQAPDRPGELPVRFRRFVRSRAFKRLLCESDLRRGWGNFQCHDVQGRPIRRAGSFYAGGQIEFDAALSVPAFTASLRELLDQGPCWYGHRLPPEQVRDLVEHFLRACPPDRDQVLSVRPDFLHSHDYLNRHGGTPADPSAICYFHGCGADHCFTWLWEDRLLVLLLNGTS